MPIVLWAITKQCERSLDSYEGFPTLYTKDIVTVLTAKGKESAMVYIMAKQYESMPALPNEHYFEIIRQGYEDHQIDTKPLMDALKTTRNELQF